MPPGVDLDHERKLHQLLADGVSRRLIGSAHDVSAGGLAVALAKCTFTGPAPLGARVSLRDRFRPDALLFGESTGRVVVATSQREALLDLAREHAVPAEAIGTTGGAQLCIGPQQGDPWLDVSVDRLRAVWARSIPRRLEES